MSRYGSGFELRLYCKAWISHHSNPVHEVASSWTTITAITLPKGN
jgi:hypothetical protein